MSQLVTLLLALPPLLVLLAVLVLPAVEASALVGLVVPGETAVFVGGLTAHAGHLPLWSVVTAGAMGAVVGDQVGFRIGRRLGPRLVDRLPARLRRSGRVEGALDLVRRRGAWAVLAGRWTAVLRALVPGLAGTSGMSARAFTLTNVLGGLSWAATVAVLGYGAGAAYPSVLATLGHAGEVGVAGVVLLVVVLLLIRRVRRRRTGEHASDGAELERAV